MRPKYRHILALAFALVAVPCCAQNIVNAYEGLEAKCPELGICLPAEFVRARDADSIEWRVKGSAFVFASRLIDCWAPELHSKDAGERSIAEAGKAFAEKQCEGKELRVYIPLPKTNQPLKMLTFDRIPSRIYLSDYRTLNELLIQNGYASSTKNGKLGK